MVLAQAVSRLSRLGGRHDENAAATRRIPGSVGVERAADRHAAEVGLVSRGRLLSRLGPQERQPHGFVQPPTTS